jgi:hypothetical protein
MEKPDALFLSDSSMRQVKAIRLPRTGAQQKRSMPVPPQASVTTSLLDTHPPLRTQKLGVKNITTSSTSKLQRSGQMTSSSSPRTAMQTLETNKAGRKTRLQKCVLATTEAVGQMRAVGACFLDFCLEHPLVIASTCFENPYYNTWTSALGNGRGHQLDHFCVQRCALRRIVDCGRAHAETDLQL